MKIKAISVFFFLFSFILSCYGKESYFDQKITELVNKLAPIDNIDGKPSIGILSFTYDNATFCKCLSNGLFEKFFSTGKYKLIERENIDKILKEQSFQLSGNVDDKSAKSIGKIIGVDFICYGSVVDVSDDLRITGKIVNIETGEIVSIGSIVVEKNKEINSILNSTTNSALNKQQENIKIKSFWKNATINHDFDGYISYQFILNGEEGYFILIDCQINKDPSKSVVYSGFYWNNIWTDTHPLQLEIKGDDGCITDFSFKPYNYKDDNKSFSYFGTNQARTFINYLLGNNKIKVRIKNDDTIVTFTTYGLAQSINSLNLKYSDISDAMKNKEF